MDASRHRKVYGHCQKEDAGGQRSVTQSRRKIIHEQEGQRTTMQTWEERICKRACCEILSLVWERVVEKGLEGEVDLSSGESEHRLQCALRWLFAPPLFLGIFLDLRV